MRRNYRGRKIIAWLMILLLGTANSRAAYAQESGDKTKKAGNEALMKEAGAAELPETMEQAEGADGNASETLDKAGRLADEAIGAAERTKDATGNAAETIERTEVTEENAAEAGEPVESSAADIAQQADTTASAVWDGSADTGWYVEGRTEFTLNTPGQLAGLAQLANGGNTFEGKRILLGRDLYFNEEDLRGDTYPNAQSWTAIASGGNNTFEGVFDGQGHVLYNMYGGALFGTIGEKGIVRAVKTDQGMFKRASIAYENKGWILFCANSSYILNAYSSMDVGGICVDNMNLIYGCGNTGKVKGGNAGGIAGRNLDKAASIDSCWNQGEVGEEGYHAGGIVSSNYGWVYDCYNAGTILNGYRTAGGIVGEHHGGTNDQNKIYNCYNVGEIADGGSGDTICGGSEKYCENVYSIPSEYNHCAAEMSRQEFKTAEAVIKLKGEKIITKWCEDKDNLNNGCIIPIAQRDMADGIYKMLPDIWNPVTEVSIDLADGEYQLRACLAYYGIDDIAPSYHTDSEILTITPEGKITPLKDGDAIVNVIFKESEYGKKAGFDVKVTVTNTKMKPGDVNEDGEVDIKDLQIILRGVCEKVTLTKRQEMAADVVKDGKVDIQDLRKVLRFVCGKVTEL